MARLADVPPCIACSVSMYSTEYGGTHAPRQTQTVGPDLPRVLTSMLF